MTGTNWSTVPVAILEMGFMSNQNDDLYITNTANHPAMVAGIADGIDEYFSIVELQTAARGQHLSQLTESLQTQYTSPLEKSGENWAIAVMDLLLTITAPSMQKRPCSCRSDPVLYHGRRI